MQDEYDAEYDNALQRRHTMRKQASLASEQGVTHMDNLGNRRLKTGVSSLGPKMQSLAPFQVSFPLLSTSFSQVLVMGSASD